MNYTASVLLSQEGEVDIHTYRGKLIGESNVIQCSSPPQRILEEQIILLVIKAPVIHNKSLIIHSHLPLTKLLSIHQRQASVGSVFINAL